MSKKLFALLITLCGVGPGFAAEVPEPPLIMVFGDSLSAAWGLEQQQGWVELLRQRLAEQGLEHRLLNASVSGETTSGGRTRLPHLLKQHRPEIVLLELGGNDGLQGHPLSLIEGNLQAMVKAIEATGGSTLLVGMQIPPNFGPHYSEGFREIFPRLANDLELPLIPFLLADVAGNPQCMQEDGIHPNAAAQPQILENVWTQLSPLL